MNLIKAVGDVQDCVLHNFTQAMSGHAYANGNSSTITTQLATEYVEKALIAYTNKLREETNTTNRKESLAKAATPLSSVTYVTKNKGVPSLRRYTGNDTSPSECDPQY